MPKTIPFKAVLPKKEIASRVVIDGANQYENEEIEYILKSNPTSFLQILFNEYFEKSKTEPNSKERFKKINQSYLSFIEKGIFEKEEQEAYYIYVQQSEHHAFKGIIGGVSCLDYKEGKVKKHEDTLTKRELMFADYLATCEFNAEPVLLTYPNQAPIDEFIEQYTTNHPPYFHFFDNEKVEHLVWKVSAQYEINLLRDSFEALDSFYIADGHHRCASSYRISEMDGYEHNERAQYCLAYFIPESNLKIYEFNRLLKLENPPKLEKIIHDLDQFFFIEKSDNQPKRIQDMEISMYFEKSWYRLIPKKSVMDSIHSVSESINTDIISKYILAPLFDVVDLKNDERVKFVSGRTGIEKQIKYVDEGQANILFTSNPISVSVVKEVADDNLTMPPKSTWIEPKLKTGLFIYEF